MNDCNPTKGTILLVDDLPENLRLLSDLLIKIGYTVRSVNSGSMALKTLKVKQPDVILLDIKMPEMDGYEVCQIVKSDEHLKDIPIIFISALDDAFDKVKAFEYGGVDYITKPFQVEEVVARLENQLTIQRQKDSLQKEIQKRQEAEEVLYQSRALLASILHTALDGIAAFQAVRDAETGKISDFRCLLINPIIAKVFQKSREDLIGKLILKKLLYRLNPDLFNRFITVVQTGEPLEEDFYYEFGESCWFHFVAVKLADGFAITVRDITARKKIELELQTANQKLELLANLDGLTQIANRRRFDHYLQQEWKRHSREQEPLSLILIDIDYFKLYNDYYGHQRGDFCLVQIAQALARVMQRSMDLIARYGGEEFAAILPNTDIHHASEIAEMMIQAIASLMLEHEVSKVSNYVTLSIGVSSLIPNSDNNLEGLISQADQALYQAKKNGRDRLMVAE